MMVHTYRLAATRLAATMLAVLLAAAAAVWLAPAADAQAADTELRIAIEDDEPGVTHRFSLTGVSFEVQSGGEITLPAVSGTSFLLFSLGDIIYADLACTDPALNVGNAIVSGVMPTEPVSCTFVVDRNTTVTVEVEAPADPAVAFEVIVVGPQAAVIANLSDGQSETFLVDPRSSLTSLNLTAPAGWQKSLACTGDNGTISVPGVSDADIVLDPGVQAVCTYTLSQVAEIYPTVTCLAGNGRIDTNIVNIDSVAHEYRLEVGALNPRVRTVAADDWWRSPVTGRPDGPIQVSVQRDGVVIFDELLTVACDAAPAVSSPEIQLLNVCRGGNGFVAWQFANPTAQDRVYIVSFDGVANRSTTAAPYGASVRGVSGRPDGVYGFSIRANGVVVNEGTVTVACD